MPDKSEEIGREPSCAPPALTLQAQADTTLRAREGPDWPGRVKTCDGEPVLKSHRQYCSPYLQYRAATSVTALPLTDPQLCGPQLGSSGLEERLAGPHRCSESQSG
ncbi:hypothetical protein AAFF_G00405740 [Aldrovandia affinis]|uniref:Uncharacterized protein n=1 Tax=Aldrovandia affinis TaxID=143900 RepID=A0AAD7SCB2_9TELE|nr:hypothetical protein AAFF_G00405740 [Aldrovandia affinis]